MLPLILICLLFTRHLAAGALALYLTWYGDPTTTMAIQWHTPLEEPSNAVEFQAVAEDWKKSVGSHLELGGRLIHRVFLENLAPDTEYSFRLGDDPAIYKFRTAPKTLSRPLRFCIGGDLYQNPDLFRKMCRTVSNKAPLFCVLGGDLAYAINGNPFKFRSTARNQWFAFLQEWKEEMISPEGQVIPFLFVPGNHDLSADDSELFFDLFAFPETRLYRAVDFGNYLSLILLDSDIFEPIEGAQTQWLDQALQARTNIPFQFAIYHKGAYPSVYSFTGEVPEKIRVNWCPLFDKYNLPLAFENHNHAFKRTFPIKGNKVSDSGVIYLGDGCWGSTPRSTHSGWYLEKREKKNNVYFLELSPKSGKVKAVDLYGEEIDSLEINPKIRS